MDDPRRLFERVLVLAHTDAIGRMTPAQLAELNVHADAIDVPLTAAPELQQGVPADVWRAAWEGVLDESMGPHLDAIEALLVDALTDAVEPIAAGDWPPLQRWEAALTAFCQAPEPVPPAVVTALREAARDAQLHPLPGAQRPQPPLPPTRPRSGRPNLPDRD